MDADPFRMSPDAEIDDGGDVVGTEILVRRDEGVERLDRALEFLLEASQFFGDLFSRGAAGGADGDLAAVEVGLAPEPAEIFRLGRGELLHDRALPAAGQLDARRKPLKGMVTRLQQNVAQVGSKLLAGGLSVSHSGGRAPPIRCARLR